jgi:N-acetylglucosamine-6-sulfatase/beta-glucosidase
MKIASIVNRLLGLDPCRPAHAPVYSRPALEPLEDRCLLDANWSTLGLPGVGLTLVGENDVAVAAPAHQNAQIVFMGDSITYGFGYGLGQPIWNQFIAPLGAWNTAVPGQTTSNILFQVESGILAGLSPAVFVLMIGTNNLFQGQTPQQTALGVVADVQAIHAWCPYSQILVLGTPPNSLTGWLPAEMTNLWTVSYLSQLPYGSQLNYAEVSTYFLQPNGSASADVLVDGIHPTTWGYALELWALAGPLQQAYTAYYMNLWAFEEYFITHPSA